MDQEIGVFQNVAQHMKLPLEFQCETGLLLRCDGKVGIPFQTKQGNCPHVEIRRGEGAQIMLCQEIRCSSRVRPVCRELFELHQGRQVPFRISRGKVEFLSKKCSEKVPHLVMTREPRAFS